MKRPNISNKSTMRGEHFQNRLNGTIFIFTRMKRSTR